MKSDHLTLTADTVATVALAEVNASFVTVELRSDHTVYFTVDGTTPTVAGDNTYAVHPRKPVQPVQVPTGNTQSVRLISAGAADVSVVAEQR